MLKCATRSNHCGCRDANINKGLINDKYSRQTNKNIVIYNFIQDNAKCKIKTHAEVEWRNKEGQKYAASSRTNKLDNIEH